MGDHWKSLANKLGAPGIDAPASQSPAEPARPQAKPDLPPPPVAEPPETVQRAILPPPPPAPEETPVPTVEAGRKDKGKRKSSWDTLTSFFGISSPEATASELSSAAPAETDSLPTPSLVPATHASPSTHLPSSPSKATALDELFGDAPRQELSWEKPARRMVDDVSGWNEDDAEPAEAKLPDLDDQADTFTPPTEADELQSSRESGGRRRRRRRRGGRRDRDREERTDEAPVEAQSEIMSDDADPWVEDLIETEAVDQPWVEPASFATDEEAELPDVLPERHSNRRRRRGRGRSEREPEGTLPTESDLRPPREPREPRGTREPRDTRESREPRESRDTRETREPREAHAIRPVREARGDQDPEDSRRESRPSRNRDRTHKRPARPASEAVASAAGPLGEEDEVDSSLAAELEAEPGSGNRHPKIPTWADSLEAIISANMDNHRRSDNRGGPPRGRPRNGGSGPNRR